MKSVGEAEEAGGAEVGFDDGDVGSTESLGSAVACPEVGGKVCVELEGKAAQRRGPGDPQEVVAHQVRDG